MVLTPEARIFEFLRGFTHRLNVPRGKRKGTEGILR
jgi:hypothetical protein